MSSENFDIAIKILKQLDADIKSWGLVVNDFIKAYQSLSSEERTLLRSNTSASVRFAFMCQYLGHFRRSAEKAEPADLESMVGYALLFIGLDNYEYDYRETILRTQGLFQHINESNLDTIFNLAWIKLKSTMPEKTILIINRLMDKSIG